MDIESKKKNLLFKSWIARHDDGDNDGAVAVDDRGEGGGHHRDDEIRQRSKGRGTQSVTFMKLSFQKITEKWEAESGDNY